MYLHLGQDTVIPLSDVVGIFDLDTATIEKATRNFLTMAEKAGRVVNVSYELPKSFVVAGKGKKQKIYISQISSTTLLKRTGFIDNIANV